MIALPRMSQDRSGDPPVPSFREKYRTVASGVTVVWPVLVLAAVCGLDAVISVRHWPIPALGLLDEAGHLLTAIVLLAALPSARIPRLAPWALMGSVAIDVDHIPLYTFAPGFIVSGRPPTHEPSRPSRVYRRKASAGPTTPSSSSSTVQYFTPPPQETLASAHTRSPGR
jgi:hypothetical protein